MKKRILSLLLMFALACSLLPMSSMSVRADSSTDIAYPVEGGNIYFDKETGTITDCDEVVTEAMIPAEIEGVVVTGIGDWAFSGCSSLINVTIPDSVTSIGYSAFSGCSSLTSVIIPEGVTSIDSYAFLNCSSLTSVTIPNSVTSIGRLAFYNAAIYNTDDLWADDVLYIDNWLITARDSITGAYTIREGTIGIADSAFDGCSSLTSVTIPDSVTSISHNMFVGCTGLTSMTIPDSITNIGEFAFYKCSSLTSVTIPDSVTNIGDHAFGFCSSLTSVTIPDSVTNIGAYAFDFCSSLTSVTIPDSVTSISNGMFSSCAGLTSVTIPDSVSSIGTSAFKGCSSLTSVTIPDSVTTIGRYAFLGSAIWDAKDQWIDGALYISNWLIDARSIKEEYTIRDGTVGIASEVFYGCESLKSITIPNSVRYVGSCAFLLCDSLTDVTIPNSVTSIGSSAFSYCDSLTTVTIPNSMTSIGESVFSNCRGLASVTIPNSVTNISYRAFSGCTNLTEVTLPNSLESISDAAFFRCDTLSAVYFAGNAPELGNDVFKTLDSETYEHVNIPDLVLYYIDGKAGWTTPTWNGYPTATWEHDHSGTEVLTAPTCTEKGYTTYTCMICGESYVDSYVEALGHSFGEWAQTKAPSCTEKGEEKHVCSRCGVTETREIAATGHTEVIDAAIAATCTEAGKTEGKHCSVCNAVLAAQEEIPALGHKYENGVCVRCGEKDPQSLPPVEFADVAKKAWYAGAVEYAVQNGLMNGVGGNQFDPEGSMTRAMLVTVLWRFEGEPKDGTNTFSDVPNGQWYTGAVAWAAANGVVNGVGNNRFDPEGKITREQMATILYRYAEKKSIDTSKRGNLGGFPDAKQVSSYAKDAVQWAVGAGIINGSDGKLLPQGSATRAQVATILMRYIENIVKK